MGGLGTELDVQVTDGNLGQSVHVHINKLFAFTAAKKNIQVTLQTVLLALIIAHL